MFLRKCLTLRYYVSKNWHVHAQWWIQSGVLLIIGNAISDKYLTKYVEKWIAVIYYFQENGGPMTSSWPCLNSAANFVGSHYVRAYTKRTQYFSFLIISPYKIIRFFKHSQIYMKKSIENIFHRKNLTFISNNNVQSLTKFSVLRDSIKEKWGAKKQTVFEKLV